jgi:hypothetical protein
MINLTEQCSVALVSVVLRPQFNVVARETFAKGYNNKEIWL